MLPPMMARRVTGMRRWYVRDSKKKGIRAAPTGRGEAVSKERTRAGHWVSIDF